MDAANGLWIRAAGRFPRSFAIDPTGELLLVGIELSNTVVSYRVDRESGRLVATEHVTEVPKPAFVAFF